jgi:hypothetical protein
MNGESRPAGELGGESTPSQGSTVQRPSDDYPHATPHERWECDGWCYDTAGLVLGKCLVHLKMPKLSTEDGIDQALDDADPSWLEIATSAVRRAARSGHTFTSDDLRAWPYGVPEPRHGSHWGALLMVCAKRGEIEQVGHRQSTRRTAQRRTIAVWRGRHEQS